MAESTTYLIERAIQGDELATARFLTLVRQHHMGSRVGRYKGRNVLVEDAEIESEFMLGCYRALKTVKMDVGDPLLYILWKGQCATLSMMQKNIRQGIEGECPECHRKRLRYRNRGFECFYCGSRDIQTWMVEGPLLDREEEDDFSLVDVVEGVSADMAWQMGTYAIQVEELRGVLPARECALFDRLVLRGHDAASSRGYIREIAQEWSVSPQTIYKILESLRSRVIEYMEVGAL